MRFKSLLALTTTTFLTSNAMALDSIENAQYGFSRQGPISHQQCADALNKSQNVKTAYGTVTLANGRDLDLWEMNFQDTGGKIVVGHLPGNGKVVILETINAVGQLTAQVHMADAEYMINELCLGFLKAAKK